MNKESAEEVFYDDLAATLRHWESASVEALTDPEADLTWCDTPEAFRSVQTRLRTEHDRAEVARCMSVILRGFAHSILVSLDGGTKMSETQTLKLVAGDGTILSSALHEGFIDYLIREGHLE